MWLARARQFDDTGPGLAAATTGNSINKSFNKSRRRRIMKNPLDSLWGTVVAGLVLTAVLYVFARNFLG